MFYKYLEHQADMGIYAQGQNWPEVFEEGARAIFKLMFEFENCKFQIPNSKIKKINIKVSARDIPELFIEWLNELLAQKDIKNLVFIDFKIKNLEKKKDLYILKGIGYGEPLDLEKHQPKLEVKAATYAGLECGQTQDKKYYCQCVVDV